MTTDQPITLADEIDCVRREVAYRKRVYQRLVAKGSMSPDFAQRQIAVMESIGQRLAALAPPPPAAAVRDLWVGLEPPPFGWHRAKASA